MNTIKFITAFFFLSAILLWTSCTPVPISAPFAPDLNPQEDINTLLDRYTDSHIDAGCDYKLLVNGNESDPVFESLIASAKDTINIETLNFDNDSGKSEDISGKYCNLLAEKARQGVTVNLLLDPITQQMTGGMEKLDPLRKAGVNIRFFMPPLEKVLLDQLFYRSHKKILIVDGRQVITGGMNYGFLYLGDDQWRDTNVLLTGPVVATMQNQFFRDWESLGDPISDRDRYFPPLESTGTMKIRCMDQRPAVNDMDVNMLVLIALRTANHHIDIEAPYFNPTDWLGQEMLQTAARGVRIRILTNSFQSIDIPSVFYAMAPKFSPMTEGGVEIYLWNKTGQTMHSKAVVVDEKLAILGSYNFNPRSIVWDTETAVTFIDPEPITQIQTMIDADMDPNNVTTVDQAWFDAQTPEDMSLWKTADDFGLLF